MRRIFLHAALFLSVGLICLSLLSGRTRAHPPTSFLPDITGSWSGDYVTNSGVSAAATLDVTDQDRRRFEGSFIFWPPSPIVPPNPCFVLGTVSHSGEISMIGANEEFFVHIHGEVADGLVSLEYERLFSDGSFETGTTSIGIETGGGGT